MHTSENIHLLLERALKASSLMDFFAFVLRTWIGVMMGMALMQYVQDYGNDSSRHFQKPCISIDDSLHMSPSRWLLHSHEYTIDEGVSFLTPYHYGQNTCALCLPNSQKRQLYCLINPKVQKTTPASSVNVTVHHLCASPIGLELAPKVHVSYHEFENGLRLGPLIERDITDERLAGLFQIGAALLDGTLNCTEWLPLGTVNAPQLL